MFRADARFRQRFRQRLIIAVTEFVYETIPEFGNRSRVVITKIRIWNVSLERTANPLYNWRNRNRWNVAVQRAYDCRLEHGGKEFLERLSGERELEGFATKRNNADQGDNARETINRGSTRATAFA